MRKFLKRVALVVGGVVVIAAIVFGIISGIKVANLATQAGTGSNALMMVLIMGACCLVGGLLLGIGLATPSHGFKEQYQQKQQADAAKAGIPLADEPGAN